MQIIDIHFLEMVVGGRFELPNPKERIYSPPRLATSLPHHIEYEFHTIDNCIMDSSHCLIHIIGDPYGIRTRVTAVKGRCLNRLTKGP